MPGSCPPRLAAPRARLVVDAKQSRSVELLRVLAPVLAELRVDLLEQPIAQADDEQLIGIWTARCCRQRIGQRVSSTTTASFNRRRPDRGGSQRHRLNETAFCPDASSAYVAATADRPDSSA